MIARNSEPVSVHNRTNTRRVLGRTEKVNGVVLVDIDLVDHVLQLDVGEILTQGAHNGADILGCDLAWSCVNDILWEL